jgi:3-oxoacyl-[acyl-carrier protein] reductase
LTAFLAGVSRQVADRNVTINNALPGRMDTERLRSSFRAEAGKTGASAAELAAASAAGVPARRFGTAEEFGAVCAFLCSAQAGYITGQNILVDGGLFPGAF